ncbi:MAG TPA: hypothetical protein VGH59_14580 [Casimicrobiaceae bacterium]
MRARSAGSALATAALVLSAALARTDDAPITDGQLRRGRQRAVSVERPDACGPVYAQVSLELNHNIDGAYFDRSGRLYRVD